MPDRSGRRLIFEARQAARAAVAAIVVLTACETSATEVPPRTAGAAQPSFAASSVTSVTSLEPLFDASANVAVARAIDDSGQVVGTSRTGTAGVDHAVIWDGSTFPLDLGTIAGDNSSFATAIARDGSVIVGASTGTTTTPVRWVRINGTWMIQALPMPAGATPCEADAVGSDGTIAGTCNGAVVAWRSGALFPVAAAGLARGVDGNGQIVGRSGNDATVWNLQTSPVSVTDLGTLGGTSSAAFGINDNGQIVGSATTSSGDSHAFLWTAKKGMVDLGTLPGATVSDAYAINANGDIVGDSEFPDGSTYAAYWPHGKIVDLGTLPGFAGSEALAMNINGQIAGISFVTVNGVASERATIWTVK